MMNPYEDDQTPPDEVPCGCGDPDCTIMDGDPTNIKVGRYFWRQSCAMQLPAFRDDKDRVFRDIVNEVRR